MLGRRVKWEEFFRYLHDFIYLLVRILGVDNATNHLHQRLHPRFLLQAADGASRQIVLKAGSLFRVKEEGVVQQQTQGQASA